MAQTGRPDLLAESRRDSAFRALMIQFVVLLLMAAVVAFLGVNLVGNLEARSIRTGFGFLWQPASFEIGQTLIAYSARASFATALLVGVINTLAVALLGIVLSTFAGFLVGIASLSRNPLVAPLARLYIETVRNIPLLLQLYVWYSVLTQMLPAAAAAPQILPHTYLAKSGLHFPILHAGGWIVAAALVAGMLCASIFHIWSARRAERTGATPQFWPLPALIILPAVAVLAAILMVSQPDVPLPTRFGFSGGGVLPPELTALVVGLSVYNASFIAEILRAGIASVDRGQLDAAAALGLNSKLSARLVVIPQALRVVVPPLANQYLNLTKNTSLAIAIGYPDLMSIGNTIINQTGQAVEVITLLMGAYLLMSLAIAAFMNWYNARVALVDAR